MLSVMRTYRPQEGPPHDAQSPRIARPDRGRRRRHPAGRRPGSNPHRRLAVVDRDLCGAGPLPVGGLQALREGPQRPGGGLLGRKVEMVVYDDQSMPATGVRLYEKLITEDKVDAVMGPYSSAISEAVANVTEKYKKVMV